MRISPSIQSSFRVLARASVCTQQSARTNFPPPPPPPPPPQHRAIVVRGERKLATPLLAHLQFVTVRSLPLDSLISPSTVASHPAISSQNDRCTYFENSKTSLQNQNEARTRLVGVSGTAASSSCMLTTPSVVGNGINRLVTQRRKKLKNLVN